MDDMELNEPSGFFLNTAVLHVFDRSSGITVFSQISLNLDDSAIDSYVTKQVRRAQNDIRCRKGYFREDSIFLKHLQDYKSQTVNFTDFSINSSAQIEQFLREKAMKSYDVLYASWQLGDIPFIGFLMLESQPAYIHQTTTEGGLIGNTIVRNHSVMPTTTKKINTFAVVNMASLEVSYVDSTDWDLGDTGFLQDYILNCTSEPSRKELLDAVNEIASDIAVQYDENPTLLLSKFKNYVKKNTEESIPLTTEELAVHVFNESEEMQNAFISKSVERELPAEIDIPRTTAVHRMKNQKIRTDTGIELTFPVEYFENPDLIEFVTHSDGRISIEIKNIGKIINK